MTLHSFSAGTSSSSERSHVSLALNSYFLVVIQLPHLKLDLHKHCGFEFWRQNSSIHVNFHAINAAFRWISGLQDLGFRESRVLGFEELKIAGFQDFITHSELFARLL